MVLSRVNPMLGWTSARHLVLPMIAAGLVLVGGLVAGAPAAGQARFDVCALLTVSEIEAVQGERVTATKASEPARSGFAVSQCFYTAATSARSVSLQVTRRDPKSVIVGGPRADWNRIFHSAVPRQTDSKPEAVKEEAHQQQQESGKPLRVDDLGDEAFWVGDRVVGAIYVLKGDAYFRLSIGGWSEESVRLKKTRELALKVLERL